MQHGAEDLALQLIDAPELDEGRRDPGALARRRAQAVHPAAERVHPGHVGFDRVAGTRVDHGPYVGVQLCRHVHDELGHRAQEHLEQPVGHVVLHA